MKNLRLAILAFLLAGTQSAGAAVSTQFGSSAASLFASYDVFFCNDFAFTNNLNPSFSLFTQSCGLQQATASELDVVHEHLTTLGNFLDMGRTSAQVDLDPTTPGAFELGVRAESFDFEGWVGALAFSIADFTYTGARFRRCERRFDWHYHEFIHRQRSEPL